MPNPLDYKRVEIGTRKDYTTSKLLAIAILLLILVQFPWFCGWAFFQREIFEDGTPKKRLEDFFVEIGLALPSIAIVLITGLRCWIEYRQKSSLRECAGSIVASVVALLFIGLAITSWVIDDIVNFNQTH